MKKTATFLLLTAAALVIFASCNSGGAGIFYSISTEKKIITSELSDKAIYKTVYAGTRLYVLAGRAVYYADENDTNPTWKKINAPDGKPYAVSLAQLSGSVYAVYESDASSPLKDSLYALNTSTFVWTSAAGTSSIADSREIQLITVDHDSGIIFISTQIPAGNYDTYSYNGTVLTSLATDSALPLIGAALLSSTYYLAASDVTGSSKLYSTNGSTWNDITTSGSFPSSKPIGGITENGGKSTLYLSTKDGYVYSSTNGTAWTKNSSHLTDTAGKDAQLGDMTTVSYNSTNYLIIAGNTGYYEWDLDSGTGPGAPAGTATVFTTYDLSKEMVFSVFADDTNLPNKLYLGSALGLWESSYSSGTVTLNQK